MRVRVGVRVRVRARVIGRLGRYSSTRSAISTRAAELALPANVHVRCRCRCDVHVHVHVHVFALYHTHMPCACYANACAHAERGFRVAARGPFRAGWPRRAAADPWALLAAAGGWGYQGAPLFPRHGCVSQAALPPPSSVHLQRHSRATFSNCIFPLATAQRHRRVCSHRVARKSTHTHSAQRHGAMRLEEGTRRTFRHHRRRRHTGRDGRAHGGERVAGGRRQEKECHDPMSIAGCRRSVPEMKSSLSD